jgi:long-chain acyl-CoA synthetase
LGGRVVGIVTGSAACPLKIARVFSAAGVPIREGYGLTETSPVLTFNRFVEGGAMLGTVGMPIKDVEIKIAEDGEILAKGPNIMQGYYKEPEKTAEVLSEDGWFSYWRCRNFCNQQ